MKAKIGSVLKFVIFLGVGLFFVYWFLLKLDDDSKAAIWQSFLSANYFWVAVAMLVSILSHVLRALRWNMLDILAFGITLLIGLALAFSTLKDWLYDQLVTKVSSLPNMWTLLAIAVAAAIVVIGGYLLFYKKLLKYKWFEKIHRIIVGFFDGLKSIIRLKRPWLFVFYSVAIYVLYLLGGYIIFKALPETSSLGMMAALVLYIFGMMVTPGGIGLYPVLVWQAVAIYGVSQEVGLASGWLLWTSQQVVVLILGFVYLIKFSILKKQSRQ